MQTKIIKPLHLALCLTFGLVSYSCTSSKKTKAAEKPVAAQTEKAEAPAPTGEALSLEPSVAVETPTSETLVLNFFREKPRTATDLNLQGPVKSVRYLTYDVSQAGDTYYKQDLVKIQNDWYYYDKSYQYTFDSARKCSPKVVLNYENKPVQQYKPTKEAKYTYKDGRITQIFRKTDGEDYWRVDFTYPSPSEVAYEESFYEGGRTVKEIIAHNIVVQTREEGGAEGDTWVRTDAFTYNAHKDVIKMVKTEKYTYLGAAEPPKTTKTVYTYLYTYDKQGNWTGKLILQDGTVKQYVTRTINYYE